LAQFLNEVKTTGGSGGQDRKILAMQKVHEYKDHVDVSKCFWLMAWGHDFSDASSEFRLAHVIIRNVASASLFNTAYGSKRCTIQP
jgi:hypothetical protein